MAATTSSIPATSPAVSVPATQTSAIASTSSDAPTTSQPVASSTTAVGQSSSVPVTTPQSSTAPGSTSQTSVSSAVTSVSSSLPVTTPDTTTSAASSSAPTSTLATFTSAPTSTTIASFTTPPATTSPTSTLASTTTPPAETSSSTLVSSDSSRGTIFSTTIVYVSGTDSRGSSFVSSSAVAGGAGRLNGGGGGGDSGPNIGAIVGGVVGGVLGAAILGALAFFYWRRKRQPKEKALDEKMFDPSRTARHSGGPNLPVDLIGDGPGGNTISPYTSGTGVWGGSAAGLATTGAAATGMGAYGHSREPSDPRYGAYPSRGSFDSTVYSGGTDPYLNNMAGFGTGMAASAGSAGANGRLPPGAAGGYGSNSGHGHGDYGYYATQPQSPGQGQGGNRRSGGWGVAAAMHDDGGPGYGSRDYAHEASPFHEQGAQASGSNRMSASAMAKLREARGEVPRHHGEDDVGEYYGTAAGAGSSDQQHRRRSSHGPSRTSEGDHAMTAGANRSSLVVHDDGGPVPEDEIPPTYDSVPRGAR